MRHSSMILFVLVCWSAGALSGWCDRVGPNEAVAVADLWYAMELNSGHLELDLGEKAARLADLNKRQVLYLLSRDNLQAKNYLNYLWVVLQIYLLTSYPLLVLLNV